MEVVNTRNHGSKRKFDDTVSASNGFNNNSNNIDLSLLEAIEKSQNTVEVVDLRTLKKLVLSFERRLKENIEARLKYPNQPDRFADSELELHEEPHKLKVLAGAPELYPDLVNLNVVPSIVDLLNHDNTDIAIDVVQLLQDLTDEDVLDDNDEPEVQPSGSLPASASGCISSGRTAKSTPAGCTSGSPPASASGCISSGRTTTSPPAGCTSGSPPASASACAGY